MDDIMNMLQSALSDPETAGKLNGLLSSLGGGESAEQTPSPQPSEPMLPDMSKLMQMTSLISKSGSQDSSIALLNALRPLLKDETQLKLDRVIKIFRIMSAYPMIRDSGLLEML